MALKISLVSPEMKRWDQVIKDLEKVPAHVRATTPPYGVPCCMIPFHERIQTRRKQLRMGVEDVVRKTGLTFHAIKKMEAGQLVPTGDQLDELSAALEVPRKWLVLGWDDELKGPPFWVDMRMVPPKIREVVAALYDLYGLPPIDERIN